MIKFGLLVLASSLWMAVPARADDVAAARASLKAMFDRPDAPLMIDPLVIEGDYGIADWSQAGAGGRALLRRDGSAWHIALCSGDAIRSAEVLQNIGLPHDVAKALARKLADAERSIEPPRLAQFASFMGTVSMDTGPLSRAIG